MANKPQTNDTRAEFDYTQLWHPTFPPIKHQQPSILLTFLDLQILIINILLYIPVKRRKIKAPSSG